MLLTRAPPHLQRPCRADLLSRRAHRAAATPTRAPRRCARPRRRSGCRASRSADRPARYLCDRHRLRVDAGGRPGRAAARPAARPLRGRRGLRGAARFHPRSRQSPARQPRSSQERDALLLRVPYEDRYIWGATAGMLVNLAEVLGRRMRARHEAVPRDRPAADPADGDLYRAMASRAAAAPPARRLAGDALDLAGRCRRARCSSSPCLALALPGGADAGGRVSAAPGRRRPDRSPAISSRRHDGNERRRDASAAAALDERRRRPSAVLAALTAGGGEARFVGGCVRDALLGRPVAISTSRRPRRPSG